MLYTYRVSCLSVSRVHSAKLLHGAEALGFVWSSALQEPIAD